MKFKKTMLLVFVLILVVGLTGCDNWQNGIDEVENATGPSWDMDLSIPLLPETTVNVGEELAEELDNGEDDDNDFIDEEGNFKFSLLDENNKQIFDESIEIGDFDVDLSGKSFEVKDLDEISNKDEKIYFDDPKSITIEGSIDISKDELVNTDGFKSLKFTSGIIPIEIPDEFILSDDGVKIIFADDELAREEDNTFSFKGVTIKNENINENKIKVKIEISLVGLTEEFDNTKNYSVNFGEYEEDLAWQIVVDNNFINNLNISSSFEADNIDFSVFDEISDYIKPSADGFEFLIDLSSDIEGFRFKFETFEFEVDEDIVKVGDFIIESGKINKLPEEEMADLINLLFENSEENKNLKVNIDGINAVDSDDEFIIDPDDRITANAEMNFYPEFEFVDDEDKNHFIYRAEPEELELDQETRDALKNNLKSVEVVQEIVNQLPFVGEIEIFIREDKVDKESFYGGGNEIIYSSGLIDLKKDDQKYTNQVELDEDFIEKLTETSPVYIGFRIKIPIEEGETVRFSIDDRIELKMWSNVTVKVNSQN